jgi:hypothetical protein
MRGLTEKGLAPHDDASPFCVGGIGEKATGTCLKIGHLYRGCAISDQRNGKENAKSRGAAALRIILDSSVGQVRVCVFPASWLGATTTQTAFC